MNRLVNEFIGTFFLVFTISVAAVYDRAGQFAPIAIGFVLVAVVYAGGHISKAHYNPAVSLAFLVRGGYISVREMFSFIAVQIVGAVAATGLAMAFFSDGVEVTTSELLFSPAFLAEILFTFLLVWVIMNVATAATTAGNQFYGIAIGFTVTGAIYTVGIYSLAALNPAVAISLWMIGKLSLHQIWIPILGSVIGAVIAAGVFNATHPTRKPGDSDS